MKFKIKIPLLDKEIIGNKDETILSALQRANIPIASFCNGKGTCGKCKIRFHHSAIAPNNKEKQLLLNDEISAGIRLACCSKISADSTIDILNLDNERQVKILVESKPKHLKLPFPSKKISPPINLDVVTNIEPTINDTSNYSGDLVKKLKFKNKKNIYFTHNSLKALPYIVHDSEIQHLSVLTYNNNVLSINPVYQNSDKNNYLLGAAVDIGTTTIAVELIDMLSGKSFGSEACLNPQKAFGEDVVARMYYIFKNINEGLEQLQSKVCIAIQDMINILTERNKFKASDVAAICAAGNSTMTHILLGITPQYIGFVPYVPVYDKIPPIPARDVGINIAPEGLLFTLPNLGGFVGGDTIADLLTIKIFNKNKLSVLIDIGTNGEIVAGKGNIAYSASTAAGPAFEGARILMGMRGESGAIDKYIIKDDGRIVYSTVFDSPPVGICGSGLVDIVSELLKAGLIDSMGKFITDSLGNSEKDERLKKRIIDYNGGKAFIVASEIEGAAKNIVLTQQDLRELQLAKAAIASGLQILLYNLNASFEDIDVLYLAGAFGNFISKSSAINIGLIPKAVDESKVISVGNAALLGAKLFLLYNQARNYAMNIIPKKVKFIELAGNPDFQEIFSSNILF